jgi:hypothetical protein
MPLFLDRLPFHRRPRRQGSEGLTISLPILITEPGAAAPPPNAVAQRWVLDTGFTGEGKCFRYDLEAAGLDPDDREQRAGEMPVRPMFGEPRGFPVRSADLWLVSNIPALRNRPHRLDLNRGIAFDPDRYDRQPHSVPPLIGMEALQQARLRVRIDYRKGTASIYPPGSWYAALGLFVRRTLAGYATLPLPWQATSPQSPA